MVTKTKKKKKNASEDGKESIRLPTTLLESIPVGEKQIPIILEILRHHEDALLVSAKLNRLYEALLTHDELSPKTKQNPEIRRFNRAMKAAFIGKTSGENSWLLELYLFYATSFLKFKLANLRDLQEMFDETSSRHIFTSRKGEGFVTAPKPSAATVARPDMEIAGDFLARGNVTANLRSICALIVFIQSWDSGGFSEDAPLNEGAEKFLEEVNMQALDAVFLYLENSLIGQSLIDSYRRLHRIFSTQIANNARKCLPTKSSRS